MAMEKTCLNCNRKADKSCKIYSTDSVLGSVKMWEWRGNFYCSDWEKNIKTYSWPEARNMMEKGIGMKRKSNKMELEPLIIHKYGDIVNKDTREPYRLSMCDLDATDWIEG